MNRRNIYVAGPLFSIAEQDFNVFLVNSLAGELPELSFILPQKYSKSISGQKDFLERIFAYCIDSIENADALLCILDGSDVDSGTAIEMGYAYARHKPIFGIRTDFRSSEDRGVNLMVSRVCTEMFWLPSYQFDLSKLLSEIVPVLKRMLN